MTAADVVRPVRISYYRLGATAESAADFALPDSRSWLQADEISLNTALSALEGRPYWKKTLGLFASQSFACLQRDVVTYNSAINGCVGKGAWARAAELFIDTQRLRMEINLLTYNGLIRSHGQVSLWQATLHYLGDLATSSPQPDMISYEAAINSCEVRRELDTQRVLLHLLQQACWAKTFGDWAA